MTFFCFISGIESGFPSILTVDKQSAVCLKIVEFAFLLLYQYGRNNQKTRINNQFYEILTTYQYLYLISAKRLDLQYNYQFLMVDFTANIFLLSLFLTSTLSITNPGILITVPFPLSPPTLDLQLPYPINDILISNLQLTSIQLRQVDYSWKLTTSYAEVNVSKAVISFDWFYKKDAGKGFFIQDQLRLDFYWNFTSNKNSRFQIVIDSTRIRPGKMKVELGGGISETVLVEVTNLILNHASIIFRGIIANKISNAITDASKILGDDVQLYHDKPNNKNIKLNTTLTTSPLFNNQVLYLQINGAPYIQGESSGFLSPPDILTKYNSSKIQVQVHKLLITKVVQCLLRVKGQFVVQFQSSSITSTIDIDSLALSPVFPPMGFYSENKDVFFQVKIPTLIFDFHGQNLQFRFSGQCFVSTQGKIDKVKTIYMDPINASALVEIAPIYGAQLSNVRVQKIEVLSFTPSQKDIAAGLIKPVQLSQYFAELMDWVAQAVNFQLNRKVISLHYQNIKVVIKGRVLNERSYNLQIDLK